MKLPRFVQTAACDVFSHFACSPLWVADKPGSAVSSGFTAGVGLVACLDKDTGMERNWYPDSHGALSMLQAGFPRQPQSPV